MLVSSKLQVHSGPKSLGPWLILALKTVMSMSALWSYVFSHRELKFQSSMVQPCPPRIWKQSLKCWQKTIEGLQKYLVFVGLLLHKINTVYVKTDLKKKIMNFQTNLTGEGSNTQNYNLFIEMTYFRAKIGQGSEYFGTEYTGTFALHPC